MVETDFIYNLSPVGMKYILRHGRAQHVAGQLVVQYISPLRGSCFGEGLFVTNILSLTGQGSATNNNLLMPESIR